MDTESRNEFGPVPESLQTEQVIAALVKVNQDAKDELERSMRRKAQSKESQDERGVVWAEMGALSANAKIIAVHEVVSQLGLQRAFMAAEKGEPIPFKKPEVQATSPDTNHGRFRGLFRRKS